MNALGILAGVWGVVMAIANFPQAYKIFKRKSAKDISIITILMFFIGSIIWTFYGIELQNNTIIYPNAIGSISLATILIGWYKYK